MPRGSEVLSFALANDGPGGRTDRGRRGGWSPRRSRTGASKRALRPSFCDREVPRARLRPDLSALRRGAYRLPIHALQPLVLESRRFETDEESDIICGCTVSKALCWREKPRDLHKILMVPIITNE
jgi:hypothetical protein